MIPSLSIHDVPMRQALTSLMKTIGAVSRIENGIVMMKMPKPWSTKVSVNFKDLPLREAVGTLAKKAGAPVLQIAKDVPDHSVRIFSQQANHTSRSSGRWRELSETTFTGGSVILRRALGRWSNAGVQGHSAPGRRRRDAEG